MRIELRAACAFQCASDTVTPLLVQFGRIISRKNVSVGLVCAAKAKTSLKMRRRAAVLPEMACVTTSLFKAQVLCKCFAPIRFNQQAGALQLKNKELFSRTFGKELQHYGAHAFALRT